MADHQEWNTTGHDGRFGEEFDSEVNVKAVLGVTVGLFITTIVGFVIAYGMFLGSKEISEATVEAASPVEAGLDRRIPDGAVLQAHPELELIEMRREMADELSSYGWVDEGAGVVRIPISKAMDLALEQGLVATTANAEPAESAESADEAATSSEETSEETTDEGAAH